MKLVILAGGQKSTISGGEEGVPKPMLEIGGRPLLWHIMKHASLCGINDFIICGGYKIEQIKEYFRDFYIYQSDIAINTATNTVSILKENSENWNIIVADTGLNDSPIERIKKIQKYVEEESFLISYGDCVTNISFEALIDEFHKKNVQLTVAVAHPSGRKIPIPVESFEHNVTQNQVKNDVWTSAGIFVAKKDVFETIEVEGDIEELLNCLDKSCISLYKHDGFWNTIETLRDKTASEKMWERGEAPWI